jgi:protein transport protein DSL1/ZW10
MLKETQQSSVRIDSRESATEIDEWLAQAIQVNEDIEKSKATAREIIELADQEKAAQLQLTDVEAKVDLLTSDILYNDELAAKLEKIQDILSQLDAVQQEALAYNFNDAILKLEAAKQYLEEARLGDALVATLVQEKFVELQKAIAELVERDCWGALVDVSPGRRRITIKRELQSTTPRPRFLEACIS